MHGTPSYYRRIVALFPQRAHDLVKRPFDIHAALGGGLDEIAAHVFGQGAAFLGGDLAVGGAVAFVADEHDGGLAYEEGGGHGRGGGVDEAGGGGGGGGVGGFLDALDLVVEFPYPAEGGA